MNVLEYSLQQYRVLDSASLDYEVDEAVIPSYNIPKRHLYIYGDEQQISENKARAWSLACVRINKKLRSAGTWVMIEDFGGLRPAFRRAAQRSRTVEEAWKNEMHGREYVHERMSSVIGTWIFEVLYEGDVVSEFVYHVEVLVRDGELIGRVWREAQISAPFVETNKDGSSKVEERDETVLVLDTSLTRYCVATRWRNQEDLLSSLGQEILKNLRNEGNFNE